MRKSLPERLRPLRDHVHVVDVKGVTFLLDERTGHSIRLDAVEARLWVLLGRGLSPRAAVERFADETGASLAAVAVTAAGFFDRLVTAELAVSGGRAWAYDYTSGGTAHVPSRGASRGAGCAERVTQSDENWQPLDGMT